MKRRSFLQALAAVPFAGAFVRPIMGVRRRAEVTFPRNYPKTWRMVNDGLVTIPPQCTTAIFHPGREWCDTTNSMVWSKAEHEGVHAILTGTTVQLMNPHPFPVRVEYEVREYR